MPTSSSRTLIVATSIAWSCTAVPVLAQDAGAHVTDVVRFLVTNQTVDTGEAQRDRAAATAASETIGRALLASVATLPTSASSAGFVYRFNPALGTLERTSVSFGPDVVERASTSGRGQVALGATWQYRSFTELDGRELGTSTLVTTANRFLDESEAFDVETLELHVKSTIATGFATVGVTDRLDLGVAIPFVWLDVDGVRTDTYHGTAFTQASATASSSGFGDVAVRGKFLVAGSGPAAVAVAGEWRLPTGREEDLLGTGSAAGRLFLVVSSEQGRVGAHGNVGFGWGGVSDDVLFAGALTFSPVARVTLAGELSGRHLSDIGRIVDISAPHPLIPGIQTTRLGAEAGGTSVVLAGGSIKWNVADTWLVKASVLLPMTNSGLTSPATITLGLDYAIEQ
jgi:hypothetical protein